MDVRVEELTPVTKKISVTVDAKTVNHRLDRAYGALGKEAQLPGFRKGKVPRTVLEEHFGSATAKQIGNEIVADTLPKVLDDEGIEIAGEPKVEQQPLRKGQPFEFTATVELRPSVELTDLEGLKVTHRRSRRSQVNR